MFRILFLLLSFLIPSIIWANINLDAVQHQGFESFQRGANGYQFSCKEQCFIVLGTLGSNEYLSISGKFRGTGELGYGFLQGDKVAPGEFIQLNGENGEGTRKFHFSKNAYFSQIPKDFQVIIIISGTITSEALALDMNMFGFFERIGQRFQEALTYIPFSPRSINFMEGPTWGGKYINQAFFWPLVFLLVFAFFWSIFEKKQHHTLKKSIKFGIGLLIFFWVFFDLLHTTNQVRMYKDFQSTSNIMENGRLGKGSDFYSFLEYAKTVIPNKEKGNFISPYPFLIEGKYHSYPDIKFDTIDRVKYLIWYNPYGENAPFGYKNPVIQSGSLLYEGESYSLDKEIAWKDYAKIYILKK